MTKKFQWEVSQIAEKKFPCAMLLGGLSVNLNHLKRKSQDNVTSELANDSEVTIYKRAVAMSIDSGQGDKRGSTSSEDLVDTSVEQDLAEVEMVVKRGRFTEDEQVPGTSQERCGDIGKGKSKTTQQENKTDRLIKEVEAAQARILGSAR